MKRPSYLRRKARIEMVQCEMCECRQIEECLKKNGWKIQLNGEWRCENCLNIVEFLDMTIGDVTYHLTIRTHKDGYAAVGDIPRAKNHPNKYGANEHHEHRRIIRDRLTLKYKGKLRGLQSTRSVLSMEGGMIVRKDGDGRIIGSYFA